MKKLFCVLFAAALISSVTAGCGGSESDVSKRESIASDVASNAESIADNIGEGVTKAVSAVVDEAEKMYDNGQVSDGDGVIGNEQTDNTEDTEDTTADGTDTDMTDDTESTSADDGYNSDL